MATILKDYTKLPGLNVDYDDMVMKTTKGAKGIVVNPPTPVQGAIKTATPSPTITEEELKARIEAQKKAQKFDMFNKQFQQTAGRLEQERAGIDPRFLEATGRTRAQGEMNLRAMENQMAQGGLSTSGSRFQSDIALRGQTLAQEGMNERDRLNQIADVERRLSEAQQTRDLGIATAESEAELALLTDQLARLRESETLAREDARTAEAQAREDFNNTIIANYNDLMGFANQLKNQGAEQWKIDAVLAARQQKIAEQGLDQQGRPIPVDTTPQLTSSSAALELWQQLGVANEAISRALGVPVGQRYVGTTRASGGSSVSTGISPQTLSPKEVTNLVTESLRGTSGTQSADMLVQMNDAGYFDNLTPSEIKSIMNKFGVDELMLEQAENRATIPTQGITLPTGRTTFPSGSGLTGMTSTIR